MTVTIVNSLPVDEWRGFVDRHPAGNVFHTPEMVEVFASTRGFKPEVWAARAQDQRLLVLFLPVRISLHDGVLARLTSRSIAFGSILCARDAESPRALELLLRAYQSETGRHSLFTELRNITSQAEYQPVLQQNGFAYADHLNYLIDLTGTPEAVFKRIGRRTQRNIKRGLNLKRVAIEEVTERSGLDAACELLRKTYHLAQVPLPDRSLFEAAFDRLQPKGMLRLTRARVGSEPAAISVELLYKDTIYGWYGGIDRAFSSFMPNELLMWDILRWGAEHGFRVYDFGGAGLPGEEYGVRNFKAKFGGELVCYGRNTWSPNPLLLKVSSLGYSVYRKFL